MTVAPDPVRGAIAGLVAGLVASLAMDLAQMAASRLQPDDGGEDDESGSDSQPATEQAADRVAQAVTGQPVADAYKAGAGQAVHYGFGALLGMGYGIAAEYWPQVRTGGGTAFGLANGLAFDEAAVPAAGLGEAPWKTPPSTHLYAIGSHLVFGGVAEGARRLVRGAL